MRGGRSVAVVILAVTGATLLFWLAIHQVTNLWMDVALRPEVRQALQQSIDDQKKLRALDPNGSDEYRRHFEDTSHLVHRLDVIRMNREQMLRRFELLLIALFVAVATAVAASLALRGDRARARERTQYLDRIADLQEIERRRAHETRGPLTAARLELERAEDAVSGGAAKDVIGAALGSVAQELERLSRLTLQQPSFAAIGAPVLRPVPLEEIVTEFCATFANAWPNTTLRFDGGQARVCADRDLVRQVLVNLCTNSAMAIGERGTVMFTISRNALDVTDTGGGIPESLRARIFDPYVTTRRIGEGMGLGLAISRKIMLDHGGDLQLVASSGSGTAFRLIFGDVC
jgi:signal transduction histidine kinase